MPVKTGCKVKICGTTNVEDAGLAASEGADFIGVVIEVDYSPRSLTVEKAEEIFKDSRAPVVALVYGMRSNRLVELVNRLKPFAVHFLSPDGIKESRPLKEILPGLQIWQSVFLPPEGDGEGQFNLQEVIGYVESCRAAGIDAVVLDTMAVINGVARFGGTGKAGSWDMAARIVAGSSLPVFLAGGIKPENVREAIEAVNPFGVDLCSGVELLPGKKSLARIRALMARVKSPEVTVNC